MSWTFKENSDFGSGPWSSERPRLRPNGRVLIYGDNDADRVYDLATAVKGLIATSGKAEDYPVVVCRHAPEVIVAFYGYPTENDRVMTVPALVLAGDHIRIEIGNGWSTNTMEGAIRQIEAACYQNAVPLVRFSFNERTRQLGGPEALSAAMGRLQLR